MKENRKMKKFLSLFLVLAVLMMAVSMVSADDFKVGVILVELRL